MAKNMVFAPFFMWRCGLRLQRYNLPSFCFLLWCMCVRVEVRRQLGGTASLFPPLFRFWGSNACWWIWYQTPLPAEPSHQPQMYLMEVSHTGLLLQYSQHTLHTENGEHITILIKLNHPCWSYRKNASTDDGFLQPTCTQYTLCVQGSPEANLSRSRCKPGISHRRREWTPAQKVRIDLTET